MSIELIRSEFLAFFDEAIEALKEKPKAKVVGFYVSAVNGSVDVCVNYEIKDRYSCADFNEFEVAVFEKEEWMDYYYDCEEDGIVVVVGFNKERYQINLDDGDEAINRVVHKLLMPEVAKFAEDKLAQLSNIQVVGIQFMDSEINDFWNVR